MGSQDQACWHEANAWNPLGCMCNTRVFLAVRYLATVIVLGSGQRSLSCMDRGQSIGSGPRGKVWRHPCCTCVQGSPPNTMGMAKAASGGYRKNWSLR